MRQVTITLENGQFVVHRIDAEGEFDSQVFAPAEFDSWLWKIFIWEWLKPRVS